MEGLNQNNANLIPLPVDLEVNPEAQIPNANVGVNPQGLIDVATLRPVVKAMNLGGPVIRVKPILAVPPSPEKKEKITRYLRVSF